MKHNKSAILCASLLIALASCTTPKDVAYFQDIKTGNTTQIQHQMDIRIRPEDKIAIMVTTSDPSLSTLFNLVQEQKRVLSTSATKLGETSTYQGNGETSYYTVDPQGNINFPVLGKIHVGGMTRYEVASYIENELKGRELVKDPIVTVEYGNMGVSVLGDVVKPGRYEFNKDRLTILDALAMAEDLQTTGRRDNVTVIREAVKGQQQTFQVDLTDMAALTQSPAYYLQQNDVIYVEPNDKKKREATPQGNATYSPSFWVSIASVGITVATLIATLTK